MLSHFNSFIKKLMLVVILAGLITPVFAYKKITADAPVIMGYWENWGTYKNFPMPDNAHGEKNSVLSGQMTGLTALAYAFLEVADDGSLQFSDAWSDLDPNSANDKAFCTQSLNSCVAFPQKAGLGNFDAFVKAPVQHHVISVGGAGHDASWESAFKHPDQFISSLQKMVSIYKNIDWLDVDYEPLGGVPSENIANFISLVTKIKQALPTLIISYTIPANAQHIVDFGQANWQSLSQNLNYISIMGYDMHGAFDKSNPSTALHSALFAEKNDFSDDAALKALTSIGVKNEKIVLGMPLYGRAVGGVQATGLGQVFTQSYKGDLDDDGCSLNLSDPKVCSGMVQYKTLVDQKYTAVPVTIAGSLSGVYAYDATQQMFVSYDNPASATAKAQYATQNKLAGVMFWALRYDRPVEDPQAVLTAVDKVYGITPHPVGPVDPKMKLQLTNNDPKNNVIITLVTADKASYYPFPQLAPKGQSGSDTIYTDINSSIVAKLMNNNNVLVQLTPAQGAPLLCQGSLNFTSATYHHIQVYYDTPVPNCLIQ